MKPYPKYINTGIEWIGEIPKHWNVTKLKRILVSQTNGIWGDKKKGNEDDLAVIRVADFDYDKFKINYSDLTYRNIDKNKARERLLKKCDIVIEKSGGGEKTPVGRAVVFNENLKAVTSNFLAKITLKEDVDSEFVVYQLSDLYEKSVNLKSIKQTTGIQNLDFENYSLEEISLPTFEEQKKIGRFLTYKLSVIEKLISKNNQLIKLLEEKKQTKINQTVTKGLNLNAKMKDSGIGWVGEIPEHWSFGKLSYFAKVQNGSTPSKTKNEYWNNGTIPWISSSKVNDGVVDQPSELISKKAFEESSLCMIPRNSVIVGMIGQGKTRGMCSILDIDTTINQNLASITPLSSTLMGKYLYYFFVSSYKGIRSMGRGANQKALNCEIVSSIKLTIPPKKEQEIIVDYLNRYVSISDKTVKLLTMKNHLLKEYRQALISNAVTGKIDVRDEEIPDKFIKDQKL